METLVTYGLMVVVQFTDLRECEQYRKALYGDDGLCFQSYSYLSPKPPPARPDNFEAVIDQYKKQIIRDQGYGN